MAQQPVYGKSVLGRGVQLGNEQGQILSIQHRKVSSPIQFSGDVDGKRFRAESYLFLRDGGFTNVVDIRGNVIGTVDYNKIGHTHTTGYGNRAVAHTETQQGDTNMAKIVKTVTEMEMGRTYYIQLQGGTQVNTLTSDGFRVLRTSTVKYNRNATAFAAADGLLHFRDKTQSGYERKTVDPKYIHEFGEVRD